MSIVRNKAVVLGGAAGLAALAIGGYFYAAHAGVAAFEDYVYENDLRDVIRYRDASYSPLSDTIHLEDVELEIPLTGSGPGSAGARQINPLALLGAMGGSPKPRSLAGRLDSLALQGVRDEHALAVRFSGYGLVTDPSPQERSENFLYELLAALLPTLRQLGVDQTKLDGAFSYRYDRDDDRLTLGLALDGANVAASSLALELARARKLMDVQIPDLVTQALVNPLAPLEDFGRIELVSLRLQIDDHGVLERMAHLTTLAQFDYQKALNQELAIDAMQFATADDTLERQLADVLDARSIAALKEFQVKGGRLELSVDTERPLRLSELVQQDRPHRDLKIALEN